MERGDREAGVEGFSGEFPKLFGGRGRGWVKGGGWVKEQYLHIFLPQPVWSKAVGGSKEHYSHMFPFPGFLVRWVGGGLNRLISSL